MSLLFRVIGYVNFFILISCSSYQESQDSIDKCYALCREIDSKVEFYSKNVCTCSQNIDSGDVN